MIDESLSVLDSINIQLNRIADALEILARPGADYSPDHVRAIEEYRGFDWTSINAQVVRADQDGPTHVQWNGKVFTRRSPSNKYEPAIWYSRATGKDEDGGTEYAKLITFRTIKDADPLPEKARVIASRPNGNGKAYAAQSIPQANKPAPADEAPSIPAEELPPLSHGDYIALAKQKFISEEAANWISRKAQIEIGGDYSLVSTYLDFFYESKHSGLKLGQAWEILEENGRDPKKAITKLPNF